MAHDESSKRLSTFWTPVLMAIENAKPNGYTKKMRRFIFAGLFSFLMHIFSDVFLELLPVSIPAEGRDLRETDLPS